MVVVVYDISDDRRRLRLSNLLEGYGRRVQYSVFECFLSTTALKQMYAAAKAVTDPNLGDNVRFYPISKDRLGKVLTIGSDPPQAPPTVYII